MEVQLIKPVYALSGVKVGEITLPEVFSRKLNKAFLSQVIVMAQKNTRRPVAHTKGRSDVRGGGKKPWRQKGTGRARHGSIRSPIWKGGGVTHGPTKNRDFKVKINKKAGRAALVAALAEHLRSDKVYIVENFDGLAPKTKNFLIAARTIFKTAIPKRLLIVTAEPDLALERGGRNVPGAVVKTARNVGVLDVLLAHRVVLSKSAFQILLKRLV